MNTTIADFVLSNPSNKEESKEDFETSLDFDDVIDAAAPTLVYIKESNIIAWYETESNIGFK